MVIKAEKGLNKRRGAYKMAEETKEETNLEEEVKTGKTSSKDAKEAQNELETKAKDAKTEAVEGTVSDGSATSTDEYIDPITEDYLVERENLITSRWFLTYELLPKKDKITNIRLGW